MADVRGEDGGDAADPQVLQDVGLAFGAPDQFVQGRGVRPRVGVGEDAQGTPAQCLAFDTQPHDLQLQDVAER